MTNDLIEIIKLIMVASWRTLMTVIDIKSHNVPNKYFNWLFLISLGFVMTNFSNPRPLVYSFLITFIVTEILFQIKGIGGADMKVLWLISLLYPVAIRGFPFALLVFAVASIGVGVYGIIKVGLKDQTIMDIKNTRIPFMPFVMVGYFVMIITTF